jgi:quinol monooxygenase YgiN
MVHGTEFALVVRFELKPGSAEAFDDLVARTLDGIEGERGTLLYLTTEVTDSPLSRVFVEVYADEEAFAAHEQTSHVREFLAAREAMVESYRVEFLHPVGGKHPQWLD